MNGKIGQILANEKKEEDILLGTYIHSVPIW